MLSVRLLVNLIEIPRHRHNPALGGSLPLTLLSITTLQQNTWYRFTTSSSGKYIVMVL